MNFRLPIVRNRISFGSIIGIRHGPVKMGRSRFGLLSMFATLKSELSRIEISVFFSVVSRLLTAYIYLCHRLKKIVTILRNPNIASVKICFINCY